MHPSILDDLGLSAALESMCLDLRQLEGMRIDFAARDVPEDIDRRVAFCLYRVCQESLRNISKHAQAQDVTVVLSGDGESLELTVIDAGIGFDTARQKPGLGTQSMKERVRLVHGTVSIDSQPGHGTRVVVKVPLHG
jgi:signal transduction histidine kinase